MDASHWVATFQQAYDLFTKHLVSPQCILPSCHWCQCTASIHIQQKQAPHQPLSSSLCYCAHLMQARWVKHLISHCGQVCRRVGVQGGYQDGPSLQSLQLDGQVMWQHWLLLLVLLAQ